MTFPLSASLWNIKPSPYFYPFQQPAKIETFLYPLVRVAK